jgi:hypothetical protein
MPAERTKLAFWQAVVTPLIAVTVFFVLFEGVLALVGVESVLRSEDPFVGFVSNVPLFVEATDADGRKVLTTAGNKLVFFNRQKFAREKAPGTYRIFCLGGSTTYGRPYDDTTSFAGWLRELLPMADTRRRWHQRRRHQLCQLPGGPPDAGAGSLRAGSLHRLFGSQRISRGANLWDPAGRSGRDHVDRGAARSHANVGGAELCAEPSEPGVAYGIEWSGSASR